MNPFRRKFLPLAELRPLARARHAEHVRLGGTLALPDLATLNEADLTRLCRQLDDANRMLRLANKGGRA